MQAQGTVHIFVKRGFGMANIAGQFGMEVRKVRKARGWTQEEVAERVGISTRWYQQIERGAVNAAFVVCVRIAQVLEMDLNRFADDSLCDSETSGI